MRSRLLSWRVTETRPCPRTFKRGSSGAFSWTAARAAVQLSWLITGDVDDMPFYTEDHTSQAWKNHMALHAIISHVLVNYLSGSPLSGPPTAPLDKGDAMTRLNAALPEGHPPMVFTELDEEDSSS